MSTSQAQHPDLGLVEVHGVTRQSFILRGALAAGAVYGAGAVAPFVSNALAAGGDVDILNFALTLEYLESNFYKVKGKSVGLSGPIKKIAGEFGDQESMHVDGLTMAIKGAGGMPAKMPKFNFPVTDEASFLKLAYTLENAGVGAYNGAGPKLMDKKLLATAGEIVQIEARHAATIGVLTMKKVTPNGGFDKGVSMGKILSKVKPLIKK